MGYRSQVGFCLTAKGYELFQKKLSTLDAENTQAKEVRCLTTHADNEVHDAATGAHLWFWSWLKWYSEYKEVAFFEEVMAALDSEEYSFVRVGESDDDCEVSGSFWDNPFDMCLSRDIDFDIPQAAPEKQQVA